jgi:hypothetical protein
MEGLPPFATRLVLGRLRGLPGGAVGGAAHCLGRQLRLLERGRRRDRGLVEGRRRAGAQQQGRQHAGEARCEFRDGVHDRLRQRAVWGPGEGLVEGLVPDFIRRCHFIAPSSSGVCG